MAFDCIKLNNQVAIGCTEGLVFMKTNLEVNQIAKEYSVYRIKLIADNEIVCLILNNPVVIFVKDMQVKSIMKIGSPSTVSFYLDRIVKLKGYTNLYLMSTRAALLLVCKKFVHVILKGNCLSLINCWQVKNKNQTFIKIFY